jgi:hypothetical protein
MADYTQITDFSAKDALSSGDPEKLILGSDVDGEFTAIASAISSKYDSTDLASQAEAEAETVNTKLMTPLRIAQWADANGGVVGDLQVLTDPNADRVLFWDDSGGVTTWLTIGTGIAITSQTIHSDDSAIVHDSLSGFVANEHIDHSAVSITAGSGLTGGGTIAANRTINVGAGTGITVNANDVALSAATQASLALADTALQNLTGSALSTLSDVTITTIAAGELLKWNGSAWVNNTLAEAGLGIGSNIQAWDANLDQIAALAVTNGNFIVGNGSAWVAESGATARTSLGLGTGDSPTFTGATLGSAVLTGPSANRLEVGGRVALIHDDAALTSGEVFFSNGTTPTTEGSNGDIFLVY